MPRHGKAAPSEIKQITFFTDEDAGGFKNPDIGEGSSAANTSEGIDLSLQSPESNTSAVSGSIAVEITNSDMPDTEIIDFEIPPEQSVEATRLSPEDAPQTEETDNTEIEPEPTSARPRRIKKERRVRGSLRRESVLLHFFTLLIGTVSRAIRNSFFAALLTSYDKTAELFRSSLLYRFFTGKPSELFKSFKKSVRRVYTDSTLPKKLSALSSALLLIKSRIYGLILFAFGVSSIFVHFFVTPYFSASAFSIYTPVIAAVLIASSLFLLFSGKTLAGTLVASNIFSVFGFKLLGLNKNSLNEDGSIELSGSGAVVLGLLFGFLTIVFPLQSILVFILSVIYVSIVLKSPEAGLISLFLIAPFASLKTLTWITAAITLSYVFKVLCGKRTLTLEFPDLFVGLFAIILIFGCFVSFGERGNVLIYLLFTGIYFIAASILRNAVWFKRSVSVILLVGSVIAFYAMIARFLGDALGFTLDTTPETDVGSASAGILDSLSVLSYFILLLGIFLFASLLICKSKATRFWLILANIATAIYLFFTLPSGAWFAAITAYVILTVLWKSRSAIYLLIASLFLPFLPALNIHSVENFFSSIVSLTARYDLWNAVIRMIADFGLGGIGLGENAFTTVYPAYFIGNTESALHAGSLLMQLLISLGIIGLLSFLAVIFFTLQSSFSYGRSCSDKSDFNRIICYAGTCGIIASFLWGINEFIWYNPRLMLLFWLITGVTVSARRSATALESDEKQANLYGDTYLE